MSKIIYNDGEGVDFNDFNLQQDLDRRRLFDSILFNLAAHNQYPESDKFDRDVTWNPAIGSFNTSLRPLRSAGVARVVAANELSVGGGLFVQTSAALDLSTNTALVAVGQSTSFGGISAATAGNFKCILVQARIVWEDDPVTPRDFEDSATRAVTTQNFLKRSELQVEYSIKEGLEVATNAETYDVTNIDSPDAGWEVLSAFWIQDSGVFNGRQFDFRKPWGRWRSITTPAAMFSQASAEWTIASGGSGWHRVSNGAANIMIAPCPVNDYAQISNNLPGAGVPGESNYSNIRIRHCKLTADWGSVPAANRIRLWQMPYTGQGGGGGVADIPGASGGGGDVSSRVSGSLAQHVIYGANNEDGPLWINGDTMPHAGGSPVFEPTVNVWMNSENANDQVYSVIWEGWGGF